MIKEKDREITSCGNELYVNKCWPSSIKSRI